MMNDQGLSVMQDTGLVDVLWGRLRARADRLIARRSAGRRPDDSRLRGEIYLLITDLIARWVDQAEQPGSTVDVDAVEGLLRAGMGVIRGRLDGRTVPGSTAP
jgi:hypothetical protein